MNVPPLRQDIQLIPATDQGRRMIAFLDPYRLIESTIALDITLLPVLQLLDGRHTSRDIQAALTRQQDGHLITLSEVESFLESLNRAFLLNSLQFRKKIEELHKEFKKQKERYPVVIGKSYESDPDTLRRFIEKAERDLPPGEAGTIDGTITGVLAPHIDINVALSTYVRLYRTLKGKKYDRVIILGINHQMQDGLYSVSEKNYITPFGIIPTDTSFIAALEEELPRGTLATDDFGHKIEHSIEFQTIFLHHYLGESLTIVPILCGSIHEFLCNGKNILEDERFLAMIERMGTLIERSGGNILIVSGVDFAHVGPKFGHETPAEVILPQAESNDREILSFLSDGKPEKIFDNAMETGNRYNVCGLSSILIFSTLLKEGTGRLVSYDTYFEHATSSAVTYASMIFTGP
jgi:hypothetical protein